MVQIQGNVKIKSVFCQKSLMKVTGQCTAFNVKNNIFILDWNGEVVCVSGVAIKGN